MRFINPFKGLRLNEKNAPFVTTLSTGYLSDEAIANHKKNNPWSYLNVFNPDHQKSASKNKTNIKTKEQFELMKNSSILIKDNIQSFYIYKISLKNHSQVGIIGRAKLSAYDNLHIRDMKKFTLKEPKKDLIKCLI